MINLIKINFWMLIISILVCQLAGAIGAFFNIKSIPKWYSKLKKPKFNPPNWIFGPVWTLLYFLMGISLYLVWNIEVSLFSISIIIFFIQLVLNIIWSEIFFGLKKTFYAFIEIIFLWFAIFFTIIEFFKVSHFAAYLLIPYILWVSFAAILNFSIWWLNRKN